jgi:putative copper export protein
MKYVLVFVLLLIVVSLAEAMFFLARDSGSRDRNRVAKALTVRIGLSVVLFVLALASARYGLIEPHGP